MFPSYEEVMSLVGIPSRWGAKIGGEHFKGLASEASKSEVK
jgi:hypothetical protein